MKNRWIVLGALLLGVMAGYGLSRGYNPAFRQPSSAGATPVGVEPGIRAEGRVVTYPGEWITLASEHGGRLVALNCIEKRPVRKGEMLAVVNRDEDRAALAEARAQAAVAEADLRLAEVETRRAHDLATAGFYSRQSVDRTDQARSAATARRDSARATVSRMEAVLGKSEVIAPFDGTVVERLANQGEAVAAGQGLCNIANLGRMRIEAEVDEFDIAKVHLGDPVIITAEGYAGAVWRGRVEEIPDSVTAPRLRPQDPAKPTDTRVLLVKVALTEMVPLKLGQRVEVRLGRL